MSYRNAASAVEDSCFDTGEFPPIDPEERMHYAWGKLARLTMELAVRNGSDLSSLRSRIKNASSVSIAILEKAKAS